MRGPGFEHVAERPHLLDVLDVARGEPGTGSGTTPTLIGNSQTGVVVVVDGHSPRTTLLPSGEEKFRKTRPHFQTPVILP